MVAVRSTLGDLCMCLVHQHPVFHERGVSYADCCLSMGALGDLREPALVLLLHWTSRFGHDKRCHDKRCQYSETCKFSNAAHACWRSVIGLIMNVSDVSDVVPLVTAFCH